MNVFFMTESYTMIIDLIYLFPFIAYLLAVGVVWGAAPCVGHMRIYKLVVALCAPVTMPVTIGQLLGSKLRVWALGPMA